MVEQSAVNRLVVGSSPTWGVLKKCLKVGHERLFGRIMKFNRLETYCLDLRKISIFLTINFFYDSNFRKT